MDLCAAEIAEASSGRVVSGSPETRFREVAIDSRKVPRGALFAAIPGARVDGHRFASTAIEAGAAGVLVMRPTPVPDGVVAIEVADTTRALQDTAASWRDGLDATVVGIAGSNGKTTTKETVAAVLGRLGAVWATPGNANSQIGAPLAVLDAPRSTRFLVLELGTSAPGELDRLARMARPHHAVVTAAFAEHLEWLESVAGVIEAETEILDSVPPDGLALIGSAEPDLVTAARRRAALRVRAVGRREEDDWRIEDVRTARDGTRFRLHAPDGASHAWHLPLLGTPAAWAAAFAVALATDLGLAPDAIQAGLAEVRPAAHRLVPVAHPTRPLLILDDCYNSNPASCIAAVETAAALARETTRLVLVVGDMLELGEATDAAHDEVGEAIAARAAEVDTVVAVGPHSRRIADLTSAAGIATHHVADADEAIRTSREILAIERPTTLLAKASRSIALDRLVAALLG